MGSSLFYIIYVAIVAAALLHLIMHGNRPTKTLAWILAIMTLPFIGMIMYYLVGINRRKLRFSRSRDSDKIEQFHRQITEIQKAQSDPKDIPQEEDTILLARLITKGSTFVPTQGNAVTPLHHGPATFDAICSAMMDAKNFIHLQYYIFEDGELAARFFDIFKKKVSEGVKIRLLYDGLGSVGLSKKYKRALEDIGVEHCSYLPIFSRRIDSTLNYRNHRKIVVVDGKIGFTGGINVADKYIHGDPKLGKWYDLHVQLAGPAVANLNAVFTMDWTYAKEDTSLISNFYFPKTYQPGKSLVQIVHSGPDTEFSSVEQQYFQLINRADEYVYIANSYVIPGEAILMSLKTAAMSGLDVRLLLPEISDSNLVKWTIRSYLPELIAAGVKIFFFPKGFLHSKLILVDDQFTSIGTANLDIRSFHQNFEINALIYDENITKDLRDGFLAECEESNRYTELEVQNRNRRTRILEGLARIFSPIL